MSDDDVDALLRTIWRALPVSVRACVVVAGTVWTVVLLWGLLR